jgi:hypothetical protein
MFTLAFSAASVQAGQDTNVVGAVAFGIGAAFAATGLALRALRGRA